MKRKIFVAAMAAVALIACERNDESVPAPAEGETVMLEVKMNSELTKAQGEGDDESSVSGYQVLVYDMADRMLEAYDTPDPSSTDVSFQCKVGRKEVIVLANAPDVSEFVSYDDFISKRSSLSDNAVGKLVMEGCASAELTVSGASITVNLKRVVSKVVLEKITVDFEQDTYDDDDFVLKNVYLTNVAADKTWLADSGDPSVWYNKVVRTAGNDVDAMIYESLGDVNLKGKDTYDVKHHFYCYPNPYVTDSFSSVWSPRPTRLVVEAMLGDVLYYYPVSLPELKQNTRYHVSLNIVRPGAKGPEQDMDRYAASFTVNIEDWQGPENVSETI